MDMECEVVSSTRGKSEGRGGDDIICDPGSSYV